MTDLTIPDNLAERLESRIQYTDFETVDEYAAFILSEIVTRAENQDTTSPALTESRAEVEDRLQSLGYLED